MMQFQGRNKHQERSRYEESTTKRRKGRVRKAKAVEVKDLQTYGAMNLDSKMALIHALIPIGLNGAYTILDMQPNYYRTHIRLCQVVFPPGVRPSSSDDSGNDLSLSIKRLEI